jgi:hypothetical protein
MTREQLIVLGFIAAAFVAGWLTGFLTTGRARRPAPAEPRPLAEEVSDALQDDAANDSMLSVFRTAEREPALSELEADLADWGFTYGVAWARASENGRRAQDEVAGEALGVAEQVFRSYTEGADWRREQAQ